MASIKKWKESKIAHGIIHSRLTSWKYFPEYINQVLLDYPGYIFRGQRSEHWKLESTIDRLSKKLPQDEQNNTADFVFATFVYAARGRRGPNPPKLEKKGWWALGQHHGLATPLLDWTTSPYVAAFFAYAEDREDGDGDATVWAIHGYSITEKSEEKSKTTDADNTDKKLIELINPLTDENARLVNQSCRFLYLPENTEIEDWVTNNFEKKENSYVLIKITIPAADREFALISLNRMNINYLSLFPDLYGASKHSNLALEIPKYG